MQCLAQFDSVIVITDRRALDTQIARTIKSYDHVASIFGHSDNAQELRDLPAPGQEDHRHHGAEIPVHPR
jgi:type I restriction enzyme R subunit